MLHINFFGQPHFLLNAEPIKFTAPPKTLPLWAYLLLQRQQPVERSAVAFTLWPDIPESDARANLRRHVHYLQRALPAAPDDTPWLITDGEQLQWNPAAGYRFDVADFERLSAAQETLPEAIALYTGDLLPNLYEDWLIGERERLRNLYFCNLSQLLLHARAQGNLTQALAYAQQVLVADPLREDIIRQLMAIRYETGDRAGALQDYDRFARLLRHELNVAPMPETQALYETVLRNAPLPGRVPQVKIDSEHAEPSTSVLPFVGRASESERLRTAWQQAVVGAGGVVLLSGEAGIGKTRLAQELARQAEAQGARVLWGNTLPDSSQPYQPIGEALTSAAPLVAALKIEPVWLATLAVLLPDLKTRRDLPPVPALNPDQERSRLFEVVTICLEQLAEPRPVLIVLEDVQWAGEAALALIEVLARRISKQRMLVLITYRDEATTRQHPVRELRRRLRHDRLAEHVTLGRLSEQDVTELYARHGTLKPDRPEAATRLYHLSEGNPLFLEILLQRLRDTGEVSEPEEFWPSAVPDRLRQLITDRLNQLQPTARTLAEVAAVLGATFDVEAAQEIGGWTEHEMLDALGELLDRRVIREAGGRARLDYAFAHQLLQTVIYDEMPPPCRKRRHHRTAQVLEGQYADLPESAAGTIGRHYELGGETQQAARYYWQAARHTVAVYADEEALALIARALKLTPPPRLRFELLTLRETIWHQRGERAKQQSDLKQLHRLAGRLADDEASCEVLRRQIRLYNVLGERSAELATITQLTAQATDPHWQAAALQAEGTYLTLINQYEAAQDKLDQALSLHRSLNDADGQVTCLCLLADVAVQQGDFQRAQAVLDQTHVLVEKQANYSIVIQTQRSMAGALFARQDFAAARTVSQHMLELCQRIGNQEGAADAHARLGATNARLFHIPAARQQYAEAERLYRLLDKRQGQAAVLVNTGLLFTRLGRYAEGIAAFQQAEQLFQKLADQRGQVVCALNSGMAAFFQADYATARSAASRGLELALAMHSQVMEANALANLGAAERELGEAEQGIQHMQHGLEIHRSLGQLAEVGTDLCDLTVAYLRTGDIATAQNATTEMLAIHAACAETMMHPQYILWIAAQTYRAAGDVPRAAELLAQARCVLQEKADAIPDPESQASFLQLPFNRDILASIVTA
jgi:DNA-binding SARP family transcriptional activator/predicted ATPase